MSIKRNYSYDPHCNDRSSDLAIGRLLCLLHPRLSISLLFISLSYNITACAYNFMFVTKILNLCTCKTCIHSLLIFAVDWRKSVMFSSGILFESIVNQFFFIYFNNIRFYRSYYRDSREIRTRRFSCAR